MVIVVIPSGGRGPPVHKTTDLNHQYLGYSDEVVTSPQYPDSGCSSDGKDCDSDVSCDHSEGDNSCINRLEDSGVYSADGDSLLLSTPSPHTLDSPRKAFNLINPQSPLTNKVLRHHNFQHDNRQHNSLPYHRHVEVESQFLSLETIKREPKTYPAVESPLCIQCCRLDATFFDPSCSGCWSLLKRSDTTPAHIFAVLRQWVPQIQKTVHLLVNMALSVGCGLADRDALTDMTLLHYSVKAGSAGVGDPNLALQVVEELIDRGADVHQRCKWTHMTALHYAAYFDVVPVLQLLLKLPEGVNIDDPCAEYDLGTPLHMAAANLCLGAAHVLLINGASRTTRDAKGRTPKDCIPSREQYELVPDVQDLITKFIYLLTGCGPSMQPSPQCSMNVASVSGKAVLQALGLKIGDRVLVNGVKTGSLRYIGPTEFATGLWAGVELESPTGRHNGCVKGVMYFRCGHNYGIFVPVNRLTKIPNVAGVSYSHTLGGRSRRRSRGPPTTQRRSCSREPQTRRSLSLPPGKVNHGRVDVSKVSSRIREDINNTKRKLIVGDRVCVDMGAECQGPRAAMGVVRFTGAVHFASGYWIGVELDDPRGANDGTIQGNRYFSCRSKHGVMAVPSRVIKITGDCDYDSMPRDSSFERSRSTSKPMTTTRSYSQDKIRSKSARPLYNSSASPQRKPSNIINSHTTIVNPAPMISNTYINDRYEIPESNVLGSIKRATSLKNTFYPSNTSMTNLNRSFSARYERARLRQEEFARLQEAAAKEPQWFEPPPIPQPIRTNKDHDMGKPWLEIGHNVFYKNMMGVIKYIGYVHFEEGIWLGIELKERKGRHDGKVQGERYFLCRQKHGLMVRPCKVTVRGLNGAELIRPDTFDYNH